MPHQLDVTFELVTPAYAGGADQTYTDGLRPPTLKALLRFWWRTLHPELPSIELLQREERIFGSTASGQGLRIVPRGPIQANEELPDKYEPGETIKQRDNSRIPNKTFPLFYMAYGTQGDNNSPRRRRIQAGSTYSFRLILGRGGTENDWHEVISAVWLMTNFGGIGTRSRRGFGGLQLQEVNAQDLPHSGKLDGFPDVISSVTADQVRSELANGLKTLFPNRYAAEPEHAAFSASSKLVVGQVVDSWEEALIAAGKVYYQLRRLLGATFNHSNTGVPVGADFRRVEMYGATAPIAPNNPYTFGSSFGLPHNYQFSDKWKPSLEVFTPDDIKEGKNRGSARRASPLMFRIIKLANRKFVPVVLWLPSRFLPDDYHVRFISNGVKSDLQPRKVNIIAALFYRRTQLDAWVGTIKQTPHDFQGYPAQPGWGEVIW